MTKFPLHQRVIEEASHLELARAVSDCVAECRRRALLNPTYTQNVTSIMNNIYKNAEHRIAEGAKITITPVLDKLKAKHKSAK